MTRLSSSRTTQAAFLIHQCCSHHSRHEDITSDGLALRYNLLQVLIPMDFEALLVTCVCGFLSWAQAQECRTNQTLRKACCWLCFCGVVVCAGKIVPTSPRDTVVDDDIRDFDELVV